MKSRLLTLDQVAERPADSEILVLPAHPLANPAFHLLQDRAVSALPGR